MLKIKKILLVIAITLCIFQMVVLATAIDIGSGAEDRASIYNGKTLTTIDKNNPANLSGKITSVDIWAVTADLSGCKVGIFFLVSGNNLTCRDYETVDNGNGAGVVLAGSKQTFTVDLDVVAGDFIGIYYSGEYNANIESVTGVGLGRWYIVDDQMPCTNKTFTTYGNGYISIGGTGATVEVGGGIHMFFLLSDF